jgi:hypothetical protein
MLQSHRTWLANMTGVANGPRTGTPLPLRAFAECFGVGPEALGGER